MTPGGPVTGGSFPDREVRVRPVRWSDWLWLTGDGLHPRKIGEQYHWLEAPLQILIAPARATLGPRGPAAIIEVDGRRAGYVGRNPLSGNLEYFLVPWARGGVGKRAIAGFLRDCRRGDRPRHFYVSYANERSKAALLGAFAILGWSEGGPCSAGRYSISEHRTGWHIRVGPG